MKLILTNINISRPQSLPATVVLDTQKQNTFVLGRGSTQCDITISTSTTDRMISRRHCQFSYNAVSGEWLFEDLSSLNGVFINHRKTNRATIKDGDIVVFGGAYGLPLGAKRSANTETRGESGERDDTNNTLAEYRITIPPDEPHSQHMQTDDVSTVVPPPQSDSQSSLPEPSTRHRPLASIHSPSPANIHRTTSLPLSHDATSTRPSLKRKSDQLIDVNINTADADNAADSNKRHQVNDQSTLADFASQLEALREENKRLNDLLTSQTASATANDKQELMAIVTQQKLLWDQIKNIQDKENRISHHQMPQSTAAATTAPPPTDADDDVQIIDTPPPSTATIQPTHENVTGNDPLSKAAVTTSVAAAAATSTASTSTSTSISTPAPVAAASSVSSSGGGAAMDDLRQKLRDEATCSVCHDMFSHPVTLSCFHSFCQNCIDSWIRQGHDQCINCRTVIEVPPYSISLPLTNMVNNLLDDNERTERRVAAEAATKAAAADKAKAHQIAKSVAQLNKNQTLLSISDTWHQKDKTTFQDGLRAGNYISHARLMYCQLVGLTDAFINETTQIHMLKKACANLNISTEVKRDPNQTVVSAKTAESRTLKELKRRLWFFLHFANIVPATT